MFQQNVLQKLKGLTHSNSGHEVTLAQQYAAIATASIPFFLLAGAGGIVFWVFSITTPLIYSYIYPRPLSPPFLTCQTGSTIRSCLLNRDHIHLLIFIRFLAPRCSSSQRTQRSTTTTPSRWLKTKNNLLVPLWRRSNNQQKICSFTS